MKANVVVKGIIFNKKLGRILIVQRSNDDRVGAGTWENVGGKIEYGEQPEEALRREITEETGIGEVGIEGIAYVTISNGKNPNLFIVYYCEACTDEVVLSGEHRAFIWADKKDCRNMLAEEIVYDFESNGVFEYIWGR